MIISLKTLRTIFAISGQLSALCKCRMQVHAFFLILKIMKGNLCLASKLRTIVLVQCTLCYTHNTIETWQEVNIGKRGSVSANVVSTSLYNGRRPIKAKKLKDLKNLCQSIPTEYRVSYNGLQAAAPSPRKLRGGKTAEHIPDNASSHEETTESESHQFYESLNCCMAVFIVMLHTF